MGTVKRPIPPYPKEARPHHAFVRWQKNERHHRLGRYCEDGGCPLCSSWKAVHEVQGRLQDKRDAKLENVGRQSGEVTAMKALSELAWSAPKEVQRATLEEEAVFAKAQRQGFWRTIRRELRDDGNYSDQATLELFDRAREVVGPIVCDIRCGHLREARLARNRLWLFASHWVCSGHLDSSPQDIPCDDAQCNDAREAMG